MQVPIKVLAKRIADAEERRQVERMYDELIATGTVEKTSRGRPHGAGPACRGGAGQVAAQTRAVQGIPLLPRDRVVTRIDQRRAAATPAPTSCSCARSRPSGLRPPLPRPSARREAAYEAVHAALDKPDIAARQRRARRPGSPSGWIRSRSRR